MYRKWGRAARAGRVLYRKWGRAARAGRALYRHAVRRGVLGEFCIGYAARAGVRGEFCTGSGAALGSCCRAFAAHRHCGRVLRTPGVLHAGGDGGFALHEAFLRRVAGVSNPRVVQFPPIGDDEVAVWSIVAPKVQTTRVMACTRLIGGIALHGGPTRR